MGTQTYYFQQSGQDKRYHFKVNDVQPDIVIQLIKESDGEYYDISSGTGFVTVTDDTGTNISSGNAIDMSNGDEGKASWTPTAGIFAARGGPDPDGDKAQIGGIPDRGVQS